MSKAKSSDTMGIVVNLSTVKGIALIDQIIIILGDSRFHAAVEMAKHSGIPYFIAAGRFGEKGFMAISCHQEEDLLFEFSAINEWLNDIKAKTTAWIIMPPLDKLLSKGGDIQ